MTTQLQPIEPGQGSRKPPKRTGWLKVTLATSGIALTMLGTGLIAQREVSQAASVIPVDSGATMRVDLQPIPTVIPLDEIASPDDTQQSNQQLQAPSLSSSQRQLRARSFTQSRSSR